MVLREQKGGGGKEDGGAAATAAQQWWCSLPIRRSFAPRALFLTLSLSGFLSLSFLSLRKKKKRLMLPYDVWVISERYLAEDSVVCHPSPVVDLAVFLYFPFS